MKKLFAILLTVVSFAYTAHAQSSGSTRYRDLRGSYNPSDYVYDFYDPYSPGWCGVASFVLPGLGQCICDEWGRGIGILAANVGFSLLEATETSLVFYSAVAGSAYYRDSGQIPASVSAMMMANAGAALLTFAGQAVFNIWNICDAVNVAKVKNMYYRSSTVAGNFGMEMKIAPTLSAVPSADGSVRPAAGVGLRLVF